MVRYYISLLGCGGGLPQHTASSMLATVRRPKALDRILDALALLQQLIDRIVLAVFQRDTAWNAAVQPVGDRVPPQWRGTSPRHRLAFQRAQLRGQPRDVQQIDALRIEDREQRLIEIALGLLAGLVADAMRSPLARPSGHIPWRP